MTPSTNSNVRLCELEEAPSRSGIRRMADLLPQIERALSSGASRTAVIAALNADGIPMPLTTFAANLYRLRKKHRKSGVSVVQAPVSTPRRAAVVVPPPPDTAHRYGPHDPRRLDDVMRSTPDMKALAKLGSREHP